MDTNEYMLCQRRVLASLFVAKDIELEKLEAMVDGGYTIQNHSKHGKMLEEKIAKLIDTINMLESALDNLIGVTENLKPCPATLDIAKSVSELVKRSK